MFGFKKKNKNDAEKTSHAERPAGLPMDLYASYEIDDVKFHDKNAKWYKATEVDSLLDKIKQTLEWHEAREAGGGDHEAHDVGNGLSISDDPVLSIPAPLADAVDKMNANIAGDVADADVVEAHYDLGRPSGDDPDTDGVVDPLEGAPTPSVADEGVDDKSEATELDEDVVVLHEEVEEPTSAVSVPEPPAPSTKTEDDMEPVRETIKRPQPAVVEDQPAPKLVVPSLAPVSAINPFLKR